MKHNTIQQLRDNIKKVLKRARPKPIFETLKNSVTCCRSGMTGLPILEIVQYAYELDININFCPMCGRKLEEDK